MVQLISYADSLGGDLAALRETMNTHFAGLFSGVHILPPFPSTGDRGFAPVNYREIDPRFGSWADIAALGGEYEVLLDLMVNHMSRGAPEFQDFLKNGEKSPYAGYFLTPRKIWGADQPPAADLGKIILRRPRPWSDYTTAEGKAVRVWTTFGATDPSEQVDLDVHNPDVRAYFRQLFGFFAANGVRTLRLDAVGYVVKKPGTSCFFVEPEIYAFLDWATAAARDAGLGLLSEIHIAAEKQNQLAARGYRVYDFLLPYTVLHTLLLRDSGLLYRVLDGRPENQITMLDCHDGVPVQPDMDGWLDTGELWRVVELCEARGARFSRLHSAEKKNPDAPDVHQICGSYHSLLGENDDATVAARAIQLFVPGIPQIYYVGLLAGTNDAARAEATGDARELNRHNYSPAEIKAACARPVVGRLMRLIRLRGGHPAFGGRFTAPPAGKDRVELLWENGPDSCRLSVDLQTMESTVETTDAEGRRRFLL